MTAVRNVMTRDVVVGDPDMSIDAARDLLRHHRISGMPVVDRQRRVLGVFSLTDDLLKNGSRVGDVMTSPAVVAGAEMTVAEIATIMAARKINRIPIVCGDVLIGIVTRADVIAYVATRRAWVEATPATGDGDTCDISLA